MNQQDQLKQLLQRTALTVSFEDFISEVASNYPVIGKIQEYHPIMVGYEAANIDLVTDKGRYVIKIFESDRQEENIESLVKVLIEAPKVGVKVPEVIKGKDGYLSHSSQDKAPYYLTKFFEGKDFQEQLPGIDEIKRVTQILARLNTLDFPVVEAYDSWGNKNLVKEFEANSDKLNSEIKDLVEPVVEQMRQLDWDQFSRSVIHGDLQLKHVLRDIEDEYCLIDFGCMSYDAKVVDVSVFLAWFCLHEKTWDNADQVIKTVLELYTQTHPLNNYELEAIPVLTKAAYSAYLMKTSILIQEGDESQETREWYDSAKSNLNRMDLGGSAINYTSPLEPVSLGNWEVLKES